jgi:VCBS repeat-containing protein
MCSLLVFNLFTFADDFNNKINMIKSKYHLPKEIKIFFLFLIFLMLITHVDAHSNEQSQLAGEVATVRLDSKEIALNLKLNQATKKANSVFISFLKSDRAFVDMLRIFPGKSSSLDSCAEARTKNAISSILSGKSKINIEIRNNNELIGAFAAFAHSFKGQPTIFINEEWLRHFNEHQIVRLLIEEYGHWLDFLINGAFDTPGDEGEVFKTLLFKDSVDSDNFNRLLLEKDQVKVVIDNEVVELELAALLFSSNAFFAEASTGTPQGTANLESNTLRILAQLPGNRVLFISDPPEAPFYSGNNVRGNVYAIDASNAIVGNWFGEISRLFKVGSKAVACQFYVYPDPNNITTGTPSTTLFLDFFADNPNFNTNDIVKTSSDPVSSALNKMLPLNTPPIADPSSGIATEAGGFLNGNLGSDAAGTLNISDNDITYAVDFINNVMLTVSDPLEIISASSTSTNDFQSLQNAQSISVQGVYGTLTVSKEGSYNYAVDNTIMLIEALRLSSNTISETFNYTVTDGKANTNGSILITIEGNNDFPLAFNDQSFAKVSIEPNVANQYGINDNTGQKALGNVLTNDTDVDQFGEDKSIIGVRAQAEVTTISQATVLQFASIPSNVSVGRYVWMDGDGIVNNSTTNAYILKTSNGTDITVSALCNTCTPQTATLSGVPFLNGVRQSLPPGTILGFSNNTAGASYSESTILGSVANESTLFKIDNVISGQVVEGMSVTGSGVPINTVVQSIDYSASEVEVTINNPITVEAQLLTFESPAGSLLTGQYGTLLLGLNGNYVYTPFANNPLLPQGTSAIDLFKYSMEDLNQDTASAILFINVLGSGTNDPTAVNDSAVAVEAGGLLNSAFGFNPTGNLLTNDIPNGGTLSVSHISQPSLDPVNAISLGTSGSVLFNNQNYDIKFEGIYGDLYVKSNGEYIYVVDNASSIIEALVPTDTLIEVFQYKLENTFSYDWGLLHFYIVGSYDAPVANPLSISMLVGDLNIIGNVLSNDTDVDFLDNLVVNQASSGNLPMNNVQTVSAGSTLLNNFTVISGLYGDLHISSNGDFEYFLDDSNSSVMALTSLSPSLVDVFSYQNEDNGQFSDQSTVTIIIDAGNKAPINTNPSLITFKESDTLSFVVANAISVFEPDDNLSFVSFTVNQGVLSFSLTGSSPFIDNGEEEGLILTSGALLFYLEDTLTENNTGSISIYGDQSQINSALTTLQYMPNIGFTGSDTLFIVSTDELSLFDSTIVRLVVEPINLVASDDFAGPINGVVGGLVGLNVLDNDLIDGISLSSNDVILTYNQNPYITILSDGTVELAPGTPPGTYTTVYTICLISNPFNCDTALVTITTFSDVVAAPISGTAPSTGGIAVVNVTANDTVNGQPVTLGANGNATVAEQGTWPLGITLDPVTGSVVVAVGTPPGSYSLTYILCDILTPQTCDTAIITLDVTPVVVATDDIGTAPSTGGIAVVNVTANDTVNGQPVTLGANGNATVAEQGTWPSGITLDPVTGSVVVAVGTPPGSYSLTYILCDTLTPQTCDTATISLDVTPVVVATDDIGTAPSTGGIAVVNVTANDTVNGQPVTLGANGNATVRRAGHLAFGHHIRSGYGFCCCCCWYASRQL